MNVGPECERCGRTFQGDDPGAEVDIDPFRPDERPELAYLCPDCYRDFQGWLECE